MAFIEDLQSLNLGWGIVIAALILGVVAIYYIDYKKQVAQPDRKPSAVTKTIIMSMVIIAIMLLVLYLSGDKPNEKHYMGMAALVVIIYLVNYNESLKFKMKSGKEIMLAATDFLTEVYSARGIKNRYGKTFEVYKIAEIKGGRLFDVVASVLVRRDIGMFLVEINPYDLYITGVHANPPSTLISERFDQPTARRYDEERMEMVKNLESARNVPRETGI